MLENRLVDNAVIHAYGEFITTRATDAGWIPVRVTNQLRHKPSHVKESENFAEAFTLIPENTNPLEKSRIFLPIFHSERSHWSIVVVDKYNMTINQYDSLRIGTCEVLFLIRKFLDYVKFFVETGNEEICSYEQFTCSNRYHQIPLLSNTYDCGIYCLMYAEYLLRSLPMAFSQERMIYFRRRIAYQLLNGQVVELV